MDGAAAGLIAGAQAGSELVGQGGPAMAAIAALSVILVALILWKLWRLGVAGAFAQGGARRALALWTAGRRDEAAHAAQAARGPRAAVLAAAFAAQRELPEDQAREETARVAKRALASARSGLRALELIALIAPLLGLLGTVLGMIAAFRALQESGASADPALLAGGIWQALLTTAAGMTVAIPASVALSAFESLSDRLRLDLEDLATRAFASPRANARSMPRAAE